MVNRPNASLDHFDRTQKYARPSVPRGQSQERVFRDRVITQRQVYLGESTLQLRKESCKIALAFLEKPRRPREVASNHGVDLRTAALQFSAAFDIAAALVAGASGEEQIVADYTSMQTKIPAELWAELKAQNLIEQNAPVPA